LALPAINSTDITATAYYRETVIAVGAVGTHDNGRSGIGGLRPEDILSIDYADGLALILHHAVLAARAERPAPR
jgi:hypothetical protein